MKPVWVLLGLWCFISQGFAAPHFVNAQPPLQGSIDFKPAALCATAQQTLDYLNKGVAYDPQVIHAGKMVPISVARIKATLSFICQHQNQLNNPAFIRQHFTFIRWYPDLKRAKQLAAHKPLLQNIPADRILMTKYFVPMVKASLKATPAMPYALYGLPPDEQHLTMEEANAQSQLIRFKYGKQAILKGALNQLAVPKLAYLSRDDLETALMQGTVIADFGPPVGKKTFNVHRVNNIAYDRTKNPYQQERFWYFKQVDGIKGYGKDADHKITVNPEVTFAADLTQFGLGKMLLIQYRDKSGEMINRAGIFADTGGAFADNLYQVDYLAGSYYGKAAYLKATQALPDYVAAYFMVLKN